MFSQKKKRSKGLLFLIPVLLVFLAGLALNAFMSGGAAGEGDEGKEENGDDRLVNAGYDSDGSYSKREASEGDNDGYIGASSDASEKGSNVSAGREYTDNAGDTDGNAAYAQEDEYTDAAGDTDGVDGAGGYYYGSDSYSEMYGGYSGYRAVSENNTLVIYKYVDGAVISEKRTDIQTDILPEYDREMLENGIDMSSESDVDELLQDYEG